LSENAENQTCFIFSARFSFGTYKNDSYCPANEKSFPSSSIADDRTAKYFSLGKAATIFSIKSLGIW
jgi:hypothetical protein